MLFRPRYARLGLGRSGGSFSRRKLSCCIRFAKIYFHGLWVCSTLHFLSRLRFLIPDLFLDLDPTISNSSPPHQLSLL